MTWPLRALGAALLVVAVVALVAPLNSWFVPDPLVVRLAAAAALLWLLVAARWTGGQGRPARLWAGVVVGTLLSAAHAVLALVPFGWDARRVFSTATLLAAGGDLPAEAVAYFARYPHNVRLLGLEQVALEAGATVGLPPLAAVLVPHVLCVAVVLWALGRGAVELGAPRAV